jgi:hypothetical protein
LPRALLLLKVRDLATDRVQQRAPLTELALDGLPRGRTLGDDAFLLGMRMLELALPPLHLGAEVPDLPEHERVLGGDAVGGIHAAEQVVEARRAQEHRERRVLAVGGVELDEASGELLLRMAEASLGHRQAVGVRRQIVLDVRELDVRKVVGLHGALEARIELLNLAEHALRLRLLRRDRRVGKCRNGRRREDRCRRDDYCRRLSSGRA